MPQEAGQGVLPQWMPCPLLLADERERDRDMRVCALPARSSGITVGGSFLEMDGGSPSQTPVSQLENTPSATALSRWEG